MRKLKVFITGSTGLLGTALIKNTPFITSLYASYHKVCLVPNKKDCQYFQLDIRERNKVFKVFKEISPQVVIHTAALSTPDYCEKNKNEAWETNVEGTKNIALACKRINSWLIFISTNGVFDGSSPPYDEKSQPNPIDFYGFTKVKGEEFIRNLRIRYTIVRLMTMYGWNNPKERKNPATWVIEALKRKEELKVVTDLFNNFLYAKQAALSLWELVRKRSFGIYHIAGKERENRFNFTKRVAKIFSLDESLLTPVTSDFFKDLVKRPPDTTFLTHKMEKELSISPLGIDEGLLDMRDSFPDSNYWITI